MNKVMAIAVIFLLQGVLVAAVEENRETIFGSEELVIEVDLSSTFTLKAEKADYSTEFVRVNLTLFPKQDGIQSVQSTELRPKPSVGEDSLLFEWIKPDVGELSYSAVYDVTTRNAPVPITRKVSFPISDFEDEVIKYTVESDNIDWQNPDIIELASSLAAGEDDLFVVVYKLAEWSNRNIVYNLSTLTAEVTKPASWVLENRLGVCDELTNIFIALNRALGIPARFVSGIAYTDSELFPERWGFHGWAEVYFPGHGWVPFDVTYGEFGFVDPGHIKLIETVDVADTTTNYQWSGRNIDVDTGPLKPVITLKAAIGKVKPNIEMTSKILKKTVGFGSYNIEEVEVTNTRNYYTVAELVHARTEGIELLGSAKRDILLKPGQTKREYFVFKVNDSLDSHFIYTFPLTTIAHLTSSESKFQSNSAANVFSLEEVNALRLDEQEEKVYSRNIELTCSSDEELYIYENVEVRCEVSNTGNVALNNLYFCHDDECELFTLGITRKQSFDFSAKFTAPGTNRVQVKVDSDTVSKAETVEVNVLDEPSVMFSEITYPESVSFKEVFKVSFITEKTSASIPVDVEVSIKPSRAVFNTENLENRKKFSAELSALDMNEGQNTLRIAAKFKDGNGRVYSNGEEITIVVEPINFIQKIERFFLRLFS